MPRSSDTYFKVAPDGTTTVEFDGHIKASGVDLPLTAVVPEEEAKVGWFDAAVNERSYIAGYSVGSGADTRLELSTSPLSGNTNSILSLYTADFPQAAELNVECGNEFRSILDQAGRSDFLQGKSTNNISISLEVIGKFSTPVTANIASGGEEAVYVLLSPARPNIAGAFVLGGVEDGFFASLATWRFNVVQNVGAFTEVHVVIGNPSARNDVRAKWTGYLVLPV